MNRDGRPLNKRRPVYSMTDLLHHKSRVDSARDLKDLAKIAADIEAKMAVEHWPTAARVEFDEYRHAKAIELMQHSAAGVP